MPPSRFEQPYRDSRREHLYVHRDSDNHYIRQPSPEDRRGLDTLYIRQPDPEDRQDWRS